MSRTQELLRAAAEAFERGSDPFADSWLSEHQVTLEECYQLGEMIATIIKGYLAAPEKVRMAIIMTGVITE